MLCISYTENDGAAPTNYHLVDYRYKILQYLIFTTLHNGNNIRRCFTCRFIQFNCRIWDSMPEGSDVDAYSTAFTEMNPKGFAITGLFIRLMSFVAVEPDCLFVFFMKMSMFTLHLHNKQNKLAPVHFLEQIVYLH